MKIIPLCILLFVWEINAYPIDVPDFFKKLYIDNKHSIDSILYQQFAEALPVFIENANNRPNREIIIPLLFYHHLFTSNAASNCTRGGILEIPYFWHWVNPNPRYDLIYIPSNKPLVKIKPPEGYSKYKSYADVDRTPSLYMSNLITDSALFIHPLCGAFFTFGWCSEREMAFTNLMTLLGYTIKIKQEGIHVWSEVLVTIQCAEKLNRKMILTIDNTFDDVQLTNLTTDEGQWNIDFGEGAQVEFYNKKAKSVKELTAVKNMSVSDAAQKRITEHVKRWIENKR